MALIEVVYENGVFRPLQPVQLPEGVRAQVNITGTVEATEPLVGEELALLLDSIADLPYVPPVDGCTDISSKHDDILYPKHGQVP